tara:strand:- start:74 stop:664 length:591 start_codon:yes stop_codon:yes gene_type:complete
MSTIKVSTISPLGTDATKTITLGESGGTLQAASGVTNNLGITMADQWRLTSDITLGTGTTVLITGLERADSRGAGQIGTAMSESSGIFSFPSTGFYFVLGQAAFNCSANDGNLHFGIQHTENNSSYSNTAFIQQSVNANQSISFGAASTSILLDITDISNQKIKFTAGSGPSSGTVIRGNSDQNETIFNFIRLGDT